VSDATILVLQIATDSVFYSCLGYCYESDKNKMCVVLQPVRPNCIIACC